MVGRKHGSTRHRLYDVSHSSDFDTAFERWVHKIPIVVLDRVGLFLTGNGDMVPRVNLRLGR